MSNKNYRPSGPLPWFLRHCSIAEWSFLGCIGTEERAIASFAELQSGATIGSRLMLEIEDKPSRFENAIRDRLGRRRAAYTSAGGNATDIRSVDLFASHGDIVGLIDDFISASNGSIVLDITSMPKRFFFPFVKRILLFQPATEIRDFVVTYSLPESYTQEPLAENFNDWAQLPLFGGDYRAVSAGMLAIGVGFEALGLQEQLKGESELPVKLLLPFPAPVAAFQRSWELIRRLRKNRNHEMFDIYRASARDCSDTFDRLVSLTDGNRIRAELAPFGPKPMSLGMCLFATWTDSQAFYTQPSVYHPDYSLGIAKCDGHADVHAFAIRLSGHDYYAV